MDSRKCASPNRDGSACGARPQPDRDVCQWHDPDLVVARRAWAGRGGRAKSNVVRAKKALPTESLTTFELRSVLCRAMKRLEAGTLEPAVATAMGSLSRAILAVTGLDEVEQRLAALESVATRGHVA